MTYLPSPLAETFVIPSVWPTSTPDGFREPPSDLLSLRMNPDQPTEGEEGELLPDFEECIIRRADQDVPRCTISPTTAIHIIRMCLDLNCSAISQEIIHWKMREQS